MSSHALRLPLVLLVACLAFTLPYLTFAAPALPGFHANSGASQTSAATLSSAARNQEFSRLLQDNNVAASDQTKFSSTFQKLPADLQTAILQSTSPRLLSPAYTRVSDKYLSAAASAALIAAMATPSFTAVSPTEGEAGTYSYATGTGLNVNCKATLDGTQLSSVYINFPPIFPNTLFFSIPTSVSRGVNHNLAVTNTATSRTSSAMAYKIIAQRSYRGYYGWAFSNFGDPTIPWTAYADYFGASAVQYSDGTHRPAAQTWYDHNYKGVGGGGNCFGMSVSSLRFKYGLAMGYWNHWLHTAPNALPFVWGYPTPPSSQTKETVQEYQGSWLSQEVLTTHATTSQQDAHAAFNRVNTLLGGPNHPVLLMWGHGSGHAVVPYATAVSGDDHQLICYDNNYPYTVTETNGPDTTISHVAWGANSFSDPTESWAQVGECMSYAEVTPPTPHLPGASFGGPGSSGAVVSADPGTDLTQVTDEGGHTFFNADGSVNTNPATRIPNSAIVYPLNASLVPAVRVGMADGSVRPGSRPTLIVFGEATGKSLTFEFGGSAATKNLQFYVPGLTLALQTSGGGKLRAFDILKSTRGFELQNPAAVRPTVIDLIHTEAAGDRHYQLRNLTGLGAASLFLRPLLDGSKLDIQAPAGLRFDHNLGAPLGQGQGRAVFAGLSTKTSRAQFGLDDWEAINSSSLLLLHLNAAGAASQTLHVAPAK